MSYARNFQVEFNHCDPAGMMFYPRYFEMTNSLVENYFRDRLNHPFDRVMAEKCGVPTLKIDCSFTHPSRLGDQLDFLLNVVHVGNSSFSVDISAKGDGKTRLKGRFTLCWVGADDRAAPLPDAIRTKLKQDLVEERLADGA